MDAAWRVGLFGGLQAERGERIISRFGRRKAGELLAYLSYYHQRVHPRELLMELLWPECDPERGRQNLSMALSSLRRQMDSPDLPGDELFFADRYTLRLNPAAVTTDVAEFDTALQSAAEAADLDARTRFLSRAVELYRGELLPGHYQEWVFPEQQRLQELLFQTLCQLIVHLEQADDLAGALQFALRAVSADPLREEAHRELIRLYAASGQPAAALRQYHHLERLLDQELGETPSPETRRLAADIQHSGVQAFRRSGVQADQRPTTNDQRPTDDTPTAQRLNAQTPERLPLPPSPPPPLTPSSRLEPVGGAVPLASQFYVVRPTDEEFRAAIARQDSIVLVKGARQTGKTSLLARGLQHARQAGSRIVFTDLQMLNAAHLESAETTLLALAEMIAEQLDLDVSLSDVWHPRRGANPNFRQFLRRHVLETAPAPVVWGLDSVDRLFPYAFGNEIFGMFRSWHNERAMEPDSPWERLTLVIAYATEAHLFITDENQSPFNVGTRLTLEDLSQEQVADLNRRYGAPLKDEAELARYHRLVSGHPYLVRRGLHEMATHGTPLTALEARAGSDEWIFGDHLRRLAAVLSRNPDLCEVTRALLQGRRCPTPDSFYRLRSAGLIVGTCAADARLRCQLYATYLAEHLLAEGA